MGFWRTIQYILFIENLMFDLSQQRKYLQGRVRASRHWFIRMSFVELLVAVLLSIILAQCNHTNLVDGVALGVLCSIPMLFLLWLPFLVTLFVVEITRPTEYHVALSGAVPATCPFTPDVYLQVPLSPPRFRLA
jgi:hypothetical protein